MAKTFSLPMESVLECCDHTLRLYGEGAVTAVARQESYSEREGLRLFMPARIGEWEGFKIIRERPPLQDGALGPRTAVLVVRHPGTHRGWVLPADEITDARTGAAGALAAAYLTLPGVSTGTIIGTGRVATALVHALDILASRPGGLQGLRDLRIYSRSPERRSAFIPSCGALQQLSLKESPSADAALQESRLVFVAAAATQPVVRMRQLTPGAHISYLAGSPTAGALDLDVITTARPLIFDQVDQARQSGEIKKVIRLGGWNQLHTCGGRLLGDAALGRVNRQMDEISLAYLTGLALLDLAVGIQIVAKGGVPEWTPDQNRGAVSDDEETIDPWQPIP